MSHTWDHIESRYGDPSFLPLLNLVRGIVDSGLAKQLYCLGSMYRLYVSPDPNALYPEWRGLSIVIDFDPKRRQFIWGFRDYLESGELDRTGADDAFAKFAHLVTRRFNWFDSVPVPSE